LLKLRLILIEKTREEHYARAEQEYLKRLQRYAHPEIVIVKGERLTEQKSEVQIIGLEADRIRGQFGKNEFRVALDRRGRQLTSEEFAEFFAAQMNRGISQISFIVGGPLGLPETLLRECDQTLALSKMTFTHELTRVILLEQIYRAFTILNHEKYHK